MNDDQQPFAPLAQNTFDGRALAKSLLRATPDATLATLARTTLYPFATLTSLATAPDGAPILLLSDLALHTQNLRADSRASLLLSQGGKGDPLAHPRLTLVGRLAPSNDPVERARFLRRHPKAALYADFGDFRFWRLHVEAAHLNGGFARAADYPGRDILTDLSDAQELVAAEAELVAEINATAREARGELAAAAGRGDDQDKLSHWKAISLDPEGLDLVAPQQTVRLVFARNVKTPAQWRQALDEALDKFRSGN